MDTGLIDRPSWDAFTDSLVPGSIRRVIVHNSVIDSGDLGEAYFTYDLRYVCLSQASRSIAQIYFGEDPDKLPVAGIPFDFSAEITARHIGAGPDTDDDDYNAEKDKQLRAKGYMKGRQGRMQRW